MLYHCVCEDTVTKAAKRSITKLGTVWGSFGIYGTSIPVPYIPTDPSQAASGNEAILN